MMIDDDVLLLCFFSSWKCGIDGFLMPALEQQPCCVAVRRESGLADEVLGLAD